MMLRIDPKSADAESLLHEIMGLIASQEEEDEQEEQEEQEDMTNINFDEFLVDIDDIEEFR